MVTEYSHKNSQKYTTFEILNVKLFMLAFADESIDVLYNAFIYGKTTIRGDQGSDPETKLSFRNQLWMPIRDWRPSSLCQS